MKESAGEANMTVITILLIGVIAAVATPLITSMMNNTAKSSCCQSKGYVWEGGACLKYNTNGSTTTITDYGWNDETNKCE